MKRSPVKIVDRAADGSTGVGEGATRSKKDGTILVEVVLAMALLVIGLGSAILTINMAMKTSASTGNMMEALHFGRDQMERVSANTYDSGPLSLGSHSVSNAQFSATYVVASAGANRKSVTLQVPWDNLVTETQSQLELRTTVVSSVHF